MRILELFAGTGTVGNAYKDKGWEVVSLDRDMDADIRADIMDWDYRIHERGYFDVTWSSPPCTEYSRSKTVGVRKVAEANEVAQRTLDIIDYLRLVYWFLENPKTGLLKDQPMMRNMP